MRWAAILLILSGCQTTQSLIKLDVDKRLLEPCPKTFPKLASGDDTENLDWSKSMLTIYAKCAKDKNALATLIQDHNEKVDKIDKELKIERSE